MSATQEERDRARLGAEVRLGPRPSRASALSVCLAYPNTYPVGMANLGFQAVWGLLVRAGVSVERVFLPDAEPGRVRSLESGRPLSSFDVVAFSVSFETDYVHLLDLLAAAGIPLWRRERGERDPLVVAGGAATFLNPEPLAEFVDLFLLGEAEGMVEEWLAALGEAGLLGGGRVRWLEASAAVAGVYRPDSWSGMPTVEDLAAAPRVRRHWVTRLDDVPTQSLILAPEAVFGDMFLVEASRGCEWGCRFCAAGFMYRPVRHRSPASLRGAVDEALRHRSTVGLVGAEMASHPGIAALCEEIALRGGRASPSSLKADLVSPALARALGRGETRSVTVAPEAGSERMRRVINKNLTEDEILRAAELLAGSGVKSLKLYAMIGLPTETEDDVLAIAGLAAKIRARLPGVGRIALSVNPFVPKPWTPFQWEPMADRATLRERARLLRRAAAAIPGTAVDVESPRDAFWQTLLSRGDRRLAPLLVAVHRSGGRYWPVVKQVMSDGGLGDCPSPERFVHRRYALDEPLPWDFIDQGVEKRYLAAEWRKAMLERETPPCDVATCQACSAC